MADNKIRYTLPKDLIFEDWYGFTTFASKFGDSTDNPEGDNSEIRSLSQAFWLDAFMELESSKRDARN